MCRSQAALRRRRRREASGSSPRPDGLSVFWVMAVRVQSKPAPKARLAGEQLLRCALDVRNEASVNLGVLIEHLAKREAPTLLGH